MQRKHFVIGSIHLALALFAVLFAYLALTIHVDGVFAEGESEKELSELQNEINARKSQIDTINEKMDAYRDEIDELSSKTAGLLNDISFIENQITLAELDIELTEIEIESQQLELQVVEEQIRQESAQLQTQRTMLKELLFTLYKSSDIGIIEIVFGSDDFSQLFSEIEQLEDLNGNLQEALNATKVSKERLENNRSEQEVHLEQLVLLQEDLESQVATLERRQTAKDLLISETQASEAQYRVLLSELRSEQQNITNQISSLQSQLQQRLNSGETTSDGQVLGGSLPGQMIHPLPGSILTARFHDPSYPFRHLFEHSGMDLAAPMGTPIRAAGDGIVAWTRTGRSYGNYVMIIHDGGYATLYAHMSGFNVAADQYVEAGEVIGFVGTTGFSTGPHLHFELRSNGIPVDPSVYIPAL